MKKTQSYQDLEVYQLAKQLAVNVHTITVNKLPKFEHYEQGSQIRRSSKSIVSNIVEGFGRRRYKNDFIMYLTYAIASCDETKSHIDLLSDTKPLEESDAEELFKNYEELGAKLYNFRQAVIKNHQTS
jgi:four helix bundle protein